MTTYQAAVRATTPNASGISGWIKRHPLPAYFILAYALSWVFILPIVASQRGAGLIALPDDLLSLLFLVATFSGPLPAALIVTAIIEGRPGLSRLLRHMVQWRVGVGWYALVLLGYPVIFLLALTAYQGVAAWAAMAQNLSLLVSFYLPTALMGIIFPSLGEEPGWRGFALPRLQRQFGPLAGTLILGTLHALWHLPVYFIPGAILSGPFEPAAFVANSVFIVGMSLLWTWLFNRAGGSVLFAMFVHGVSNATSGLMPQLGFVDGDAWFGLKIGLAIALVIVIATRGRLGYRPETQA